MFISHCGLAASARITPDTHALAPHSTSDGFTDVASVHASVAGSKKGVPEQKIMAKLIDLFEKKAKWRKRPKSKAHFRRSVELRFDKSN